MYIYIYIYVIVTTTPISHLMEGTVKKAAPLLHQYSSIKLFCMVYLGHSHGVIAFAEDSPFLLDIFNSIFYAQLSQFHWWQGWCAASPMRRTSMPAPC